MHENLYPYNGTRIMGRFGLGSGRGKQKQGQGKGRTRVYLSAGLVKG